MGRTTHRFTPEFFKLGVISVSRRGDYRQPKIVAISGLKLFVSHIADSAQQFLLPQWQPRVVQVKSKASLMSGLSQLCDADVWYSIGEPIGNRWLHRFWRLTRRPRVVHWVGTDITLLRDRPHLRSVFLEPNVVNLAEVHWTVEELATYGIKAHMAPLPPRIASETVRPLPETFTVLIYMPRTRNDAYRKADCERLIAAMSRDGVRFLIVGGGDVSVPEGADVRRLGWCSDLRDAYDESTVLLRLTQRDGLSLMALEALTHGRYVVWTQPLPHVICADNYDEVEAAIRSLLARFRGGTLLPQYDAAQYVSTTYDTARCLQTIGQYWNTHLACDVVPVAGQAT